MLSITRLNDHLFVYAGQRLLVRIDGDRIGRSYIRTDAEERAVNKVLPHHRIVHKKHLWRLPCTTEK